MAGALFATGDPVKDRAHSWCVKIQDLGRAEEIGSWAKAVSMCAQRCCRLRSQKPQEKVQWPS